MIRHDIDHQTHLPFVQRLHQPIEILARAELGIEQRVINHVVAMHAAGARLEDR